MKSLHSHEGSQPPGVLRSAFIWQVLTDKGKMVEFLQPLEAPENPPCLLSGAEHFHVNHS